MEELSRYNSILTSIYAQDNAYRVASYLIALALLHRASSRGAKPDELDAALSDLRGKIGDARFLNRVFVGTTASVQGFLAGDWSTYESVLDRVMALAMVAYHPLEHAYLQSTLKPAPLLTWVDGAACSKWSCRMWLAYVLCDLLGTVRKLGAVNNALAQPSAPKTVKLLRDRRNLLIWLSCIAADFPLALQWSVDAGPFGEKTIAVAGLYGGLAGLYLRWLRASDAARDAKEKAQ